MKRRNMLLKIVFVLFGILVLLGLVGWIGLQFKPARFPSYPEKTGALSTILLPADLPEPVARHLQLVTGGGEMPLTESAVLSGPARLEFMGISFNSRWRFVEDAGRGYRHYFELTLFGQTIFSANETILDGTARMELPFGVEEGLETDQAASVSQWAEQAIWMPSVLINDPRLRWEPVDDSTARLFLPFTDGEGEFLVRFDPETGLLDTLEAMRYKEAGAEKVLWTVHVEAWDTFHGLLLPLRISVAWADEDRAWAIFEIEEVVYNVDVEEYIRAKGL